MFIIVNSAKYNRQENAALFKEIRQYIFRIPELFRALSADTAVLKSTWTAYLTMMHRGKLPFAIKEIVALMTSEVNSCQYCTDFHQVFLTACEQSSMKAHDTLFGEQQTESYRRHLRHFIYKVVRQHGDLNDVDVSQYKNVFRTDSDRLEAVLLMSTMTFFTTFADAAGVNLEFIPDDTPARRNLMKTAVRQSRKKRLQHAEPFYVRFEDLSRRASEPIGDTPF